MRRHELRDKNGLSLQLFCQTTAVELNVSTTAGWSTAFCGASGLVALWGMCRSVMVHAQRFTIGSPADARRVSGIDSSCVCVHQHGANAKKGALPIFVRNGSSTVSKQIRGIATRI